MTRQIQVVWAIVVATVSLAGPRVEAVSISVPNASFESSILADGADTGGSGFAGWGGYSDAGTWVGALNPLGWDGTSTGIYGYLDAGGNGTPQGGQGANVVALYTGIGTGTVKTYVILTNALQAGTYRLTVAVGHLSNHLAAPFTIGIGTSDLSSGSYLASYSGAASEVTNGYLADKTVTLNVTSNNSHLGQPLVITLSATGDGSGLEETEFDNVRLDYIASESIAMPNAGFENDILVDGGDTGGNGIAYWGGHSDAGTWVGALNPVGWDGTSTTTLGYLDAGSSGTPRGGQGANVAALYTGNGTGTVRAFSTFTTHFLRPGTYMLTVAVGHLSNRPAAPFTIGIGTSNLPSGTYLASYSGAASEVPNGYMTDKTVILNVPLDNSNLGFPLVITLSATGDGSGLKETDFDNVRLELAPVPISRGRRIILNKGIQVGGWVYSGWDQHFNPTQFTNANYTTADRWMIPEVLPELPVTMLYGCNGRCIDPMAYLNYDPTYTNDGRMISLNYQDEPGPHNSADPDQRPLLNPDRLGDVENYYNYWRGYYRNALMYLSSAVLREYTANSNGTDGNESGLRTYMQSAKPDMLLFQGYPDYDNDEFGSWYDNMMSFRTVALEGYDNTGTEPICYGQFLRMYRTSWDGDTPSESYIYLQRFMCMAFGYTFFEDYTYNGAIGGDYPVIFNSDWTPNGVYTCVAAANTQVRNLSPAMARLVSTDVRILMGKHRTWPWYLLGGHEDVTNDAPGNITTNMSNVPGYITGVTASNIGGANYGLRGDVVVGFFKPLLEDFDGLTWSNQQYFMIANGLTRQGTWASGCRQQITVDFNFGFSGITGLQRMKRTDSNNDGIGDVETIIAGGSYTDLTFTSLGNNCYRMVLTLNGGQGDLFKYNTGAPFVGSNSGQWTQDRIPGDANEDGVVDVGDLGILAANYGQSGKTWTQGDFNGDDKVDVGDLGILAANYGNGTGSALDFNADAESLGLSVEADQIETDELKMMNLSDCSLIGLPLMSGLLLAGGLLSRVGFKETKY
jgi:hypothetical protein